MARGVFNIDQQIEKAEAKVAKAKAALDAAKEELKGLTEKRDKKRKEELWDTVLKSGKSYDEILEFVGVKNEQAEENV